ncbi:hypothetical protein VTK73DRAFT_9018 [Phialemonium thermophilum]|uniref:Uncharacterized protein n=1 Tax=Phialemonium thermophilum TaxID=223376 RepID=A0ABR3W515_9PEZI
MTLSCPMVSDGRQGMAALVPRRSLTCTMSISSPAVVADGGGAALGFAPSCRSRRGLGAPLWSPPLRSSCSLFWSRRSRSLSRSRPPSRSRGRYLFGTHARSRDLLRSLRGEVSPRRSFHRKPPPPPRPFDRRSGDRDRDLNRGCRDGDVLAEDLSPSSLLRPSSPWRSRDRLRNRCGERSRLSFHRRPPDEAFGRDAGERDRERSREREST